MIMVCRCGGCTHRTIKRLPKRANWPAQLPLKHTMAKIRLFDQLYFCIPGEKIIEFVPAVRVLHRIWSEFSWNYGFIFRHTHIRTGSLVLLTFPHGWKSCIVFELQWLETYGILSLCARVHVYVC